MKTDLSISSSSPVASLWRAPARTCMTSWRWNMLMTSDNAAIRIQTSKYRQSWWSSIFLAKCSSSDRCIRFEISIVWWVFFSDWSWSCWFNRVFFDFLSCFCFSMSQTCCFEHGTTFKQLPSSICLTKTRIDRVFNGARTTIPEATASFRAKSVPLSCQSGMQIFTSLSVWIHDAAFRSIQRDNSKQLAQGSTISYASCNDSNDLLFPLITFLRLVHRPSWRHALMYCASVTFHRKTMFVYFLL